MEGVKKMNEAAAIQSAPTVTAPEMDNRPILEPLTDAELRRIATGYATVGGSVW
jgi:hypothetical protein